MQITCKNCNKRKKCRPKSSTQYFVNSRNSYSLNSAESGWENSILQRLKFGWNETYGTFCMKNAPESDVMPLKLKGKLECFQPLLGKKKNRLRRRPGLDTDVLFLSTVPFNVFWLLVRNHLFALLYRGESCPSRIRHWKKWTKTVLVSRPPNKSDCFWLYDEEYASGNSSGPFWVCVYSLLVFFTHLLWEALALLWRQHSIHINTVCQSCYEL